MKFVKGFKGAKFNDIADEINNFSRKECCEVISASLTYDDFDGYLIALCVFEGGM